MALPEVKFETFWDEEVTFSPGIANVSLKGETIILLLISYAFGMTLWGWFSIPLHLPGVAIDFGVLGPLFCAVPFFVSLKLFTLNRKTVDVIEDFAGLVILPEVIDVPDSELVPPYIED